MHEFHETCHSVTFYFMKKDPKRCCDTTTPESIHTKDESKSSSAFAFIFGVNWPVQSMKQNDKFHGIYDICLSSHVISDNKISFHIMIILKYRPKCQTLCCYVCSTKLSIKFSIDIKIVNIFLCLALSWANSQPIFK